MYKRYKSKVHVHNRRLKDLSDGASLTEFGKAFQHLLTSSK